jgi:hypothetical protein
MTYITATRSFPNQMVKAIVVETFTIGARYFKYSYKVTLR